MELTEEQESRGLTEEGIIHIPGLASRWVRLANGAKAHYVTAGDTGPAVILLHGGIVGSSGTAGWRFMAPFLGANGFRVYCPDQPAFGWADSRPEHWPLQGNKSYVEFVQMFADALCLDRFHISGNSMGCTHAAYVAAYLPERVISAAYIAGLNACVIPRGQTVPAAQGKFTPNPNFKNTAWDGSEESMPTMMEGIIYNASAVWPELITMRNDAGVRQREVYEARRDALRRIEEDP